MKIGGDLLQTSTWTQLIQVPSSFPLSKNTV